MDYQRNNETASQMSFETKVGDGAEKQALQSSNPGIKTVCDNNDDAATFVLSKWWREYAPDAANHFNWQDVCRVLHRIRAYLVAFFSVMAKKASEVKEAVAATFPHEYTFEDANRKFDSIQSTLVSQCPCVYKVFGRLSPYWPYLLLGVFMMTASTIFVFGEATEDFRVLPGPFYRGHPRHMKAKIKKKEM